MYCCVKPTALLTVAGVIRMETKEAGVMVNVALLEVTPPSCALILTEPTAAALASPALLKIAFVVSLEFQVTEDVMS